MKKKSAFLCLLLFLCISFVSADDKEQLQGVISQIDNQIQQDQSLRRNYYKQARAWSEVPILTGTIRQQMLTIRDRLLNQLTVGMDISKAESVDTKKALLATWENQAEKADVLDQNCLGRYQMMDMLSYAYDFPTAVTIAVWRRESSCGYYLPKNGDGPFQIVSMDYSGVSLNKESFEDMVQDFLLFSKNKIARYNKKNLQTPIRLSYQNISQPDLLKFAALYNGLSGGVVNGDILPAAPRYFWEKMSGEFEGGKRNGLFATVLKVLQWEIDRK